MRLPAIRRPGKGTDDFLEPIPLRRRPDLCLRMPEGSDQRRNLGRRFNVVGDKDIEVIARPEYGIAAEPLHGWAPLSYAFHDVALELFKEARRTISLFCVHLPQHKFGEDVGDARTT
jgi:hypothetical protein